MLVSGISYHGLSNVECVFTNKFANLASRERPVKLSQESAIS